MGRNKLDGEKGDIITAEETNGLRLGNMTENDVCRELQAV